LKPSDDWRAPTPTRPHSSNSSKKKATQVHPIWGLGRWKGAMNARSVKAWLLPRGSTLFKGRPPHSNPQASWAKSPPMSSRVLTLRHGGWVPHVMRADPKRKKPNRHTRSMQPPRGYKHSLILAETSGRKGGPRRRKHATAPRLCTLSALSHPTVQHGGPGLHVM
jgi:hypothetical protein